MIKQFLEIGRIVAVQGLKGEVRVEPWCDTPDFLCGFKKLYFKKGEEEVKVSRARPHKNIVVMKINGVDTPESAAELRGKVLYINRKDVNLKEGTYFVQDLIGLEVTDADSGEIYGRLSQVTSTGANDVYHIKNGDREWLIPAIPDVIVKTDIEGGRMIIRKMDGLFE